MFKKIFIIFTLKNTEMIVTFLIQKINFPGGKPLEINNKPDTEKILRVQKSMTLGYGSGSVVVKNGCSKGFLNDRLGNSIITDFKISDNKLEFKQQYDRGSEISYVFRHKTGDVWNGLYFSEEIKGKTNCIITIVKESFFEPQ